ncbi:MAG: fucose isomerase, partial [Prevotella sp.]|nr:fucose isomerase [Prevotella sp.]
MKNKKKLCFGVIIGTRAYFNSELARDVRKHLLKTIEEQGYEYVILPEDATPTGSSSIETREDGLKCAELFRQNRDRIDGIIVSLPNFGFEIGIINAISVADLRVPVLVQACDDENDKVDLDSRRDAFCGKISVCNNLYQYGIPFTDTTLHTYSIYSDMLVKDINKFAAICRVVNGLKHARIGQIGTRPLGFNTCRASEKLLQASGITVVPADLSEVIFAAQKIDNNDPELVAQMEKVCNYASVPEAYKEKLTIQAKFGLAVERWVEANQVDAVAIQCWDSLEQNYGCAACVTMSM